MSIDNMMKAIVWDGRNFPDGLTYTDFDTPKLRPGWVLVNTKAAGICGSDLHYLLGYTRSWIPDKNLPAVLGHENAGIVIEVGEGVTSVKPGDRVAVEPLHGCIERGLPPCKMCKIGKYHLCQNGLTHVGIPLVEMLPGGYGEYSIAHESRLFHVPDNVALEDAALLDILAVGVHAVKLVHPGMGDSTVVYGCGIIGLDMIQCLRVEGVKDIIAIAKYEFQADIARRLGATETIVLNKDVDPVKEVMKLTGEGADQVYECVGGETDALDESVSMCRMGGKAVMLGVFPGKRPMDLFKMLWKEVDIISSNSYSTAGYEREFQLAMDLLRDGKVTHQELITHRYAPEQWCDAINMAISKGKNKSIKTMFVRE